MGGQKMATTSPTGNLLTMPISRATSELATPVSLHRRRRLSREDGLGIEMLGHAIEYLADEFALDCLADKLSGNRVRDLDPRVKAIEILMAFSRQIYLNSPEVPTWSERVFSWLRPRQA
jgi:hypothetical protein